MKIYVSLSKKNKKLLKYAILFILGCILIYYSSILSVNAQVFTSVVLNPTTSIYDRTGATTGLNHDLELGYLNDQQSVDLVTDKIILTGGSYGMGLTLNQIVDKNHTYLISFYFLSKNNIYINPSYALNGYLKTGSYLDFGLSSSGDYQTLTLSQTILPIQYNNMYVCYNGGCVSDYTYVKGFSLKWTETTEHSWANSFISVGFNTQTTSSFGWLADNLFLGYTINDVTTLTSQDIDAIIKANSDTSTIINSINNNTNSVVKDAKDKIITEVEEQGKLTQDAIKDQTEQDKQQHEETMDTITGTDTSGADSEANSFFNDFESNDFGLSDIITLPLTTIQSITSKSCTPLNLTLPFVNKSFQLPCMTTIYSKFEPFYSIYQTITFGVISYWVCVQIYAMVKGFKDPAKDEIEVMDL